MPSRNMNDLRYGRWGGLVTVFRVQLDGSKRFIGYKTPYGEWCDEHGVKLGEETFGFEPLELPDEERLWLEEGVTSRKVIED